MSIHALKVDSLNNLARLDVYLTQNLPDVPSRTFVKKLIEASQPGDVIICLGAGSITHWAAELPEALRLFSLKQNCMAI